MATSGIREAPANGTLHRFANESAWSSQERGSVAAEKPEEDWQVKLRQVGNISAPTTRDSAVDGSALRRGDGGALESRTDSPRRLDIQLKTMQALLEQERTDRQFAIRNSEDRVMTELKNLAVLLPSNSPMLGAQLEGAEGQINSLQHTVHGVEQELQELRAKLSEETLQRDTAERTVATDFRRISQSLEEVLGLSTPACTAGPPQADMSALELRFRKEIRQAVYEIETKDIAALRIACADQARQHAEIQERLSRESTERELAHSGLRDVCEELATCVNEKLVEAAAYAAEVSREACNEAMAMLAQSCAVERSAREADHARTWEHLLEQNNASMAREDALVKSIETLGGSLRSEIAEATAAATASIVATNGSKGGSAWGSMNSFEVAQQSSAGHAELRGLLADLAAAQDARHESVNSRLAQERSAREEHQAAILSLIEDLEARISEQMQAIPDSSIAAVGQLRSQFTDLKDNSVTTEKMHQMSREQQKHTADVMHILDQQATMHDAKGSEYLSMIRQERLEREQLLATVQESLGALEAVIVERVNQVCQDRKPGPLDIAQLADKLSQEQQTALANAEARLRERSTRDCQEQQAAQTALREMCQQMAESSAQEQQATHVSLKEICEQMAALAERDDDMQHGIEQQMSLREQRETALQVALTSLEASLVKRIDPGKRDNDTQALASLEASLIERIDQVHHDLFAQETRHDSAQDLLLQERLARERWQASLETALDDLEARIGKRMAQLLPEHLQGLRGPSAMGHADVESCKTRSPSEGHRLMALEEHRSSLEEHVRALEGRLDSELSRVRERLAELRYPEGSASPGAGSRSNAASGFEGRIGELGSIIVEHKCAVDSKLDDVHNRLESCNALDVTFQVALRDITEELRRLDERYLSASFRDEFLRESKAAEANHTAYQVALMKLETSVGERIAQAGLVLSSQSQGRSTPPTSLNGSLRSRAQMHMIPGPGLGSGPGRPPNSVQDVWPVQAGGPRGPWPPRRDQSPSRFGPGRPQQERDQSPPRDVIAQHQQAPTSGYWW